MATFTVKIIRQDIDTYSGVEATDADEAISKVMNKVSVDEPTITQNCIIKAEVE